MTKYFEFVNSKLNILYFSLLLTYVMFSHQAFTSNSGLNGFIDHEERFLFILMNIIS